MDGIPWMAKIDDDGKAAPLLPPMSMFPPKKRPEADEIEDGAEIIVWDSRAKKWLRIQGGGSSAQYAVVMEAISQPDDATAEPPSGMGKVRILGKTYQPKTDENGETIEDDEGNPIFEYDDCTCFDLAETEKILKGRHVEIAGPYQYKNPDFNTENEEENEENEKNPKFKTYYNAVHTAISYSEKLESKLEYDGTSTIKIADGDEEETFTVHCKKLNPNQSIAEGSGVTVARTMSASGWILEVMLGSCPEELEEE